MTRSLAALWIGVAFGTAAAWDLKPELPMVHQVPSWVFEASRLRLPPHFPTRVEATGYCSCPICCGRWALYGLTHSGSVPKQGRTIAADWHVLPAGACVWLAGFGKMRVEDTGSAIVGAAVDVYFDRHEDALAFGRHNLEIRPCLGGQS